MKVPLLTDAEGRIQPWRVLWAVTAVFGFVYTGFWTIFLSAFGGWDISSLLFPLIWLILAFVSFRIGVRIGQVEHVTIRRVLSVIFWIILLMILYEMVDDLVAIFLL